jgi:hypothetical protein
MTPAEIVTWSEAQDAAGRTDAMGGRWTDWKLAVRNPDGTCARDQHGHQTFETQAQFKARPVVVPVGRNLELFA